MTKGRVLDDLNFKNLIFYGIKKMNESFVYLLVRLMFNGDKVETKPEPNLNGTRDSFSFSYGG